MALSAEGLLVAEPGQCGPEQIFIESGRPMFVGVGECGTARGFADAQVNQTALAAGQTVADLA